MNDDLARSIAAALGIVDDKLDGLPSIYRHLTGPTSPTSNADSPVLQPFQPGGGSLDLRWVSPSSFRKRVADEAEQRERARERDYNAYGPGQ